MDSADFVTGKIDYVIWNMRSRTVRYRGSRSINKEDVEIGPPQPPVVLPAPLTWLMSLSKTKYSPSTFYRKQIKLQGGFTICLPDTPVETREELVGFGISAGRTSMQTFSWEWFVVDSDDHATKIQERGELRIGVTQGSVGWELTSMEFLTDISLRICPFPAARLFGPGSFLWPPQVQWRIHILKGSHISWPSVDTLQTEETRRHD